MRADFDAQPELIGSNVSLRPLTQDDFHGLSAAASSPEVWAGHPAKGRHKKEIFERYASVRHRRRDARR